MLRSDTRDIQNAFGHYCRDGKSVVPKVFLRNNLPQYRRMILDLISNTLKKAYPLSHNILGDEKWRETVKKFFERHPCKSNQIWKLPKEFMKYAHKERLHEKQALPYLLDLLKFEWSEIEVFMMTDQQVSFFPIIDWKKDTLLINPYLVILDLNYSIHIALKQGSLHQERYTLACYRGWEDFYVYYIKLSAFGKNALQWLIQGHNFSIILSRLTPQVAESCFEKLEFDAKCFFHSLIEKNIILGKKN